MTEHNINSGEGAYVQDSSWNFVWKFLNDVDLTIRLNNENAFVWWIAKRFYSFIGDGQNGTIDGAIMNRGWSIAQYSKFAKEMKRVRVTASGTTADNVNTNSAVNSSSFNIDSTDVKITAFESEDGKTISLVMYTPTNTDGDGGHNMGTMKIKLPAGFTADYATAMRSTSNKQGATESVIISADRNYAIVTLPRSEILSVRFIKTAE